MDALCLQFACLGTSGGKTNQIQILFLKKNPKQLFFTQISYTGDSKSGQNKTFILFLVCFLSLIEDSLWLPFHFMPQLQIHLLQKYSLPFLPESSYLHAPFLSPTTLHTHLKVVLLPRSSLFCAWGYSPLNPSALQRMEESGFI